MEQLVRDNEQLKAEVKELLNSSGLATSSRDQGKMSLFTDVLVHSPYCLLTVTVKTFSCYISLCAHHLKFSANKGLELSSQDSCGFDPNFQHRNGFLA